MKCYKNILLSREIQVENGIGASFRFSVLGGIYCKRVESCIFHAFSGLAQDESPMQKIKKSPAPHLGGNRGDESNDSEGRPEPLTC
jgi:hypothetical protein